jgi:streptomycin 6-kinase
MFTYYGISGTSPSPVVAPRRQDVTVEFALPSNLVRAVEHDLLAGHDRRSWLADLPGIVGQLTKRWALMVGRPFEPGGSASWVAPARAAGTPVVLKVGWRHDEALFEVDALRVWDGAGAVRVIDSLVFGDTIALLLEACEPGVPLRDALPDAHQDVVATTMLRRLHIEPPPNHPFPTLVSMCDGWADAFERRYAEATTQDARRLDAGLARTGIGLFRSLPRSATRTALLCTDLHPGNILSATREPWLMIDPKPHVGDPAYDAVQYMLNFPERLDAGVFGFVARMAGLLEVDEERVRLWLFARCVQESVDWPALQGVARTLAP